VWTRVLSLEDRRTPSDRRRTKPSPGGRIYRTGSRSGVERRRRWIQVLQPRVHVLRGEGWRGLPPGWRRLEPVSRWGTDHWSK